MGRRGLRSHDGRIDAKWKGQDDRFIEALLEVARRRPVVRFVFLGWGDQIEELRGKIGSNGLRTGSLSSIPSGRCVSSIITVPPTSSSTTSSWATMDRQPSNRLRRQALVMKLRREHYAPLYRGDVMPAFNADEPDEIAGPSSPSRRCRPPRLQRYRMREWLVRNHGEERTVPLLLALLRQTADRSPAAEIQADNPLLAEESAKEKRYTISSAG